MKKYIVIILVILACLFFTFGLKPKEDLLNKLQNYIATAKKENKLKKASLYIESLTLKNIIGIDQNEKYYTASLLKLPLLIDFLHEAQKGQELLQEKLTFSPEIAKALAATPEEYPPVKDPLVVNRSYSVMELLTRMIKASDNGPAMTFAAYLPGLTDKVIKTMSGLGLNIEKRGEFPFASPFDYSKIFSSLFDKKFLNSEMSEKAIDMLIDTDYKEALVAGVPSDIKVAHKFGVYTIPETNDWGLNDCGIVYKQNNPYTICVMTIGKNIHELEGVMKDLSQIVYRNIKN